ncbi:Uncharacterised protein [uncultured Comamonas sp.]|nr:Uncharacterised protein [uncultured Comamonas sp.]
MHGFAFRKHTVFEWQGAVLDMAAEGVPYQEEQANFLSAS